MRASFYRINYNYSVYDSRASTATVGTGSTTTNIVFSEPVTGAFENDLFVLVDSSDAGYGEYVQSEVSSGGDVSEVALFAPLPNAPVSGVNFSILSKGEETLEFVADMNVPDEGVSFSTNIKGGFSSCTLSVDIDRFLASTYFNILRGFYVRLYDNYARSVWEGIVSFIGVSGGELRVDCMGVYDSLNSQVYLVNWAADSATTCPAVVRDVVSDSFLIKRDYRNIDKGDVIDTNQGGVATGIGPITLSESHNTGMTAIDSVIKYGDYSDDMNPVFFQVWEDRIPSLSIYPRLPSESDVNWYIDPGNVVGGVDTIALENDMTDIYGRVSIMYTDALGRPAQSPWKHHIRSMVKNGPRELLSNSGDIPPGASIVATDVLLEEKKDGRSTGGVSVDGMVRIGNSSERDFAYMIRAGDFVSVPSSLMAFGGLAYEFEESQFFLVTSTSFSGGRMSLTFGGGPKMLETLSAIFAIDGI